MKQREIEQKKLESFIKEKRKRELQQQEQNMSTECIGCDMKNSQYCRNACNHRFEGKGIYNKIADWLAKRKGGSVGEGW